MPKAPSGNFLPKGTTTTSDDLANSQSLRQHVTDILESSPDASFRDDDSQPHTNKNKYSKKSNTKEGDGSNTNGSTDVVTSSSNSNSSSSKELVVKRWMNLFSTLHFLFHMVWFQFFLYYGRFYVSFIGGTMDHFNRKIVIIGDDTAIGVGDWVTLFSYPGVHRRLNDVINKDITKRAIGRGVFWNAFDGGRSGTMSGDWLPEKEMSREMVAMKRKWRLVGTRNLFDSLFDPNIGQHRDADIVVIMVGQYDLLRVTAGETKLNLIKILVELAKRNKFAIVCTIPNYPSIVQVPHAAKQLKTLNEAIREAVLHVQTEVLAGIKERHGMVQLADLIQRPLPRNFFRFQGRFLSGRGYDTITTDILSVLQPMMRLVDQDKAIPKVTRNYSHFR